jgi:hypothetical protein
MVSEATRDEVFTQLQENSANTHCFDCNATGPLSVSMSFAVFLCEQCAETHAKLGFEVRAIQREAWSVRQLRLIKAGGNEAFAVFLREYEIEKELDAGIKYRTSAAEYYRLRLAAEGREMSISPPTKDTGSQPYTTPITHTPPPQAGLFGRAVAVSREAGGRLLSGLGSTVAVQSIESSTKAALSSVGGGVRTGAGAVSQTIAYQMAKETAASAARTLGESAKGLYHRFWRAPDPSQ